MFLQVRAPSSWREAPFLWSHFLADVSIWRRFKANRQPQNCTRIGAFSQAIETAKNLYKLPVSGGLQVRPAGI